MDWPCNGIRMGCLAYMPDKFADKARGLIATLRPHFQQAAEMCNLTGSFGVYAWGPKFRSDSSVLQVLASGIMNKYLKDQDIPDEPGQDFWHRAYNLEYKYLPSWVWDALRECAMSDHWYTYGEEYD